MKRYVLLCLGFVAACGTSKPRTGASGSLTSEDKAGPALFEGSSRIDLTFKADFPELFAAKDKSKWVPLGIVSSDGTPLSESGTRVKLRGNTSLDSCRFPKLSVKFETPSSKGLFAGMRSFKVATHCDVDTARPTAAGRLESQDAVERERWVYGLLGRLGFAGRRTRPLSITYQSTTGATPKSLGTFPAFALEHEKDFATRIGGRIVEVDAFPGGIPPPAFHENLKTRLRRKDVLALELFEDLINNRDWIFSPSSVANLEKADFEVLNVDLVELPDGTFTVTPQDFDLSGMVTWKHGPGTRPSGREFSTRRYQMQHAFRAARLNYTKEEYESTLQRLLPLLEQAERDVMADTSLDLAGRESIAWHIRMFLTFHRDPNRFQPFVFPETMGRTSKIYSEGTLSKESGCVFESFMDATILEETPKAIRIDSARLEENADFYCVDSDAPKAFWIEKPLVLKDAFRTPSVKP